MNSIHINNNTNAIEDEFEDLPPLIEDSISNTEIINNNTNAIEDEFDDLPPLIEDSTNDLDTDLSNRVIQAQVLFYDYYDLYIQNKFNPSTFYIDFIKPYVDCIFPNFLNWCNKCIQASEKMAYVFLHFLQSFCTRDLLSFILTDTTKKPTDTEEDSMEKENDFGYYCLAVLYMFQVCIKCTNISIKILMNTNSNKSKKVEQFVSSQLNLYQTIRDKIIKEHDTLIDLSKTRIDNKILVSMLYTIEQAIE